MLYNKTFIQTVTRLVLAAFLYSFVAFEPLYGITTMGASAGATRTALDRQLDTLVLSARQGRISEGCYVSPESGVRSPESTTTGNSQLLRSPVSGLRSKNNRLVIFIQDLHCNPEVQKNINSILAFFDTKYGLNKIFVEGAPEGKTNLSLFTGIADQSIKDKTLDSLLNEGLLSGAVYYGAKNNKENIYGLENWGLYKENANRMSVLLSDKSGSSAVCSDLGTKLEKTLGLHGSSKLITANYKFNEASKSKERYNVFAKTAVKNDISLLQFPNLNRQVAISLLSRQIRFKKLPQDLQAFLKGIQEKTPYGVYKTIAEKLSDSSRDGEFYLNLQEVAYTYAPNLLFKYANVANFLEYVRLNYSVNPMALVEEEGRFKQAVLERNTRTLIDQELVFMQGMTDMLKGFAALGMTPTDYAFFKNHVEEYKITLMKYYGPEQTAEVRKLLDNKELYAYYDINLQRNEVFAKALLAVRSPEPVARRNGNGRGTDVNSGHRTPDSGPSVINEYTEVIKHLSEFTEIDAVVTGGFHVETAKAFKRSWCFIYNHNP